MRRAPKYQNVGFTIVEVLIVIVVIGILVTIVAGAYGNWRMRTAENEVKSDLSGAATAMENARNFGNGYPSAIPASMQSSSSVTLTYVSGDTSTYCINGQSTVIATVRFYVESGGGGPKTGSCS